jgi:hypothetical protein
MKTDNAEEAALATPGPYRDITTMWKLIDPVDLELRDRGYGVKL